jgi:myo-inositol catabolism protein IolC
VAGEPNDEETARISDAKKVIYEGAKRAVDEGAPRESAGVLVDEQFGADIARDAKASALLLAMPVEKSGQDEFDFQYGEDFGKHIEGIDRREDCETISAATRAGGRDRVACVVLGRGADDARVDHWLRMGSGVPGYIGFAIGRSIWWDPLKAFVDGNLGREEAAKQIASNYRRFIDVYNGG